MFNAQTILRASQAARSVVPSRSAHIIAAPPKNKVSKVEFSIICAIFAVSNFAYPTYVLHNLTERKKQK